MNREHSEEIIITVGKLLYNYEHFSMLRTDRVIMKLERIPTVMRPDIAEPADPTSNDERSADAIFRLPDIEPVIIYNQ